MRIFKIFPLMEVTTAIRQTLKYFMPIAPAITRPMKVAINTEEIRQQASAMRQRLQQKSALMDRLDQHNQEQLRLNQRNKVIKFTRDNVLGIEEINGKIIFLERGYQSEDEEKGSGYRHILRHEPEFRRFNVSVAKLPMTLFNALKKNAVLGYQCKTKGRPIYQSDNVPLAITVGSNGYIVGCNPKPMKAVA